MAALVQGIVSDAQTLIRQELTLARTEIKKDWNDIKEAGLAMGAGAVLAFLGGIFLCLMVVFLLGPDVAGLPYWLASLIVGGLLTVVGGAFLGMGVAKLKKIEPGPEQTIQSIKEIL